jgi:hypothetical protein
VQLVPILSDREKWQLLAALMNLGEADVAASEEAGRLRREILETVCANWNENQQPILQDALQHYYEASVSVVPLVPGPHLDSTWEATSKTFREGILGAYAASAVGELLVLVQENEPRFLRQIGWPDTYAQGMQRLQKRFDAFFYEAEDLAERIRESLDVEPHDISSASSDAYYWRRAVRLFRTAGGDVSADLDRLAVLERRFDSWIEEREIAAAEDAELVEEPGDEDADPQEADDFDIPAIFSDL